MLCNTWNGAFSFYPPGVAEAYGAVGMRVSQQSLAKVVNPLVQLIWNVGCLEYHNHTCRADKENSYHFSFTIKCEEIFLTLNIKGVHFLKQIIVCYWNKKNFLPAVLHFL